MPECSLEIEDRHREKKRWNFNQRAICNGRCGIQSRNGVIFHRCVSDSSGAARPLWRSQSTWKEMFFVDAAVPGNYMGFQTSIRWCSIFMAAELKSGGCDRSVSNLYSYSGVAEMYVLHSLMSWLNMTMSIVFQNLVSLEDYTNKLINPSDSLQSAGVGEQYLSDLWMEDTPLETFNQSNSFSWCKLDQWYQ